MGRVPAFRASFATMMYYLCCNITIVLLSLHETGPFVIVIVLHGEMRPQTLNPKAES